MGRSRTQTQTTKTAGDPRSRRIAEMRSFALRAGHQEAAHHGHQKREHRAQELGRVEASGSGWVSDMAPIRRGPAATADRQQVCVRNQNASQPRSPAVLSLRNCRANTSFMSFSVYTDSDGASSFLHVSRQLESASMVSQTRYRDAGAMCLDDKNGDHAAGRYSFCRVTTPFYPDGTFFAFASLRHNVAPLLAYTGRGPGGGLMTSGSCRVDAMSDSERKEVLETVAAATRRRKHFEGSG